MAVAMPQIDDLEDAYPLAMLQAGMLFHSEYRPDSAIYHDIFSYHLRAPFVRAALDAALRRLMVRHAALRTSFDLRSFSEPLQLVHRSVEPPLEVSDLRHLDDAAQDAAVAAWMEAEKTRHFDWERAPLLRFQIHQRSEDTFQFTLSFHHAILDGWSVAALLTELFQLYFAFLRRQPLPIDPPPRAAFRDFVALEREALASDECRRFWLQKLSGSETPTLPCWSSARTGTARQIGRHDVAITAAVSAGLRTLARVAHVPITSVLLAAHLRVVYLLSGQSDILTGLLSNGRPEQAGGAWIDLVRETFRNEQESLPFRRYPMAEIQRLVGRQPLFETMFTFTNFHVYQRLSGVQDIELLGATLFEETDVTLDANFSQDLSATQLYLSLSYDMLMFPGDQIAAIGGYYASALSAIADAPYARYDHQDLLSEAEREQLLVTWNDTAVAYPPPHTLPPLLAAQAERSPDAAALQATDFTLSFQALHHLAARLAAALQQRGAGPDSIVALALPRSPDFVLALLATIQAGAAFLPLDLASPSARLAFILQEAQPSLLLTTSALRERLPACSAPLLCLDAALGAPTAALAAPALHPEQLAYLLYTSGSTGTPKGVLIGQRAIVNRLRWMQASYQLGPSDRVLHKTSAAFDVAVWELCWPLLSGGTLVLAPPDAAADLALLSATISAQRITVLHFVPSVLALWLAALSVGACGSLRLLISSGEALESSLAARALSQLEARLDNLYGPTEAAIDVSCWPCPRPLPAQPVPIGHPIANTQLYVLDAHMQPAPIGVLGELYLGGLQLARGYHNRPELTAERFVPNPFADCKLQIADCRLAQSTICNLQSAIGTRLYKTGDLARYRPTGEIEFVGRIDQQVKLRGYRIELGEVEAALLGHAAVAQAAVVKRGEGADARLVAYVVQGSGVRGQGSGATNDQRPTTNDDSADKETRRQGDEAAPNLLVSLSPPLLSQSPSFLDSLRDYLRQTLPDYMLPAHFVLLSALPLTVNGKLDRAALPEPQQERPADARPFRAPRTPTETAIANVWAEVLKLEQVGIDDNFFELGGHSLLAVEIVFKLRDLFQVELALQSLFDARTVANLATAIIQQKAEDEDSTLIDQLFRELEQLSEEEARKMLEVS